MQEAIPWYKSEVLVSALVAIISQLLALLGRADVISVGDLTSLLTAVLQVVAILAGAWTVKARTSATAQPVTLTQAQADIRNSETEGGAL